MLHMVVRKQFFFSKIISNSHLLFWWRLIPPFNVKIIRIDCILLVSSTASFALYFKVFDERIQLFQMKS